MNTKIARQMFLMVLPINQNDGFASNTLGPLEIIYVVNYRTYCVLGKGEGGVDRYINPIVFTLLLNLKINRFHIAKYFIHFQCLLLFTWCHLLSVYWCLVKYGKQFPIFSFLQFIWNKLFGTRILNYFEIMWKLCYLKLFLFSENPWASKSQIMG